MEKEDKYLKGIGRNIREKRELKRFSQQELADHCNIAKSTIQRIEKGTMNPTILMLKNIAEVLTVSIEEIIKV